AMWGAAAILPTFGLGWRVLFPIYAVVGTLALLLLGATKIEERPADRASSVVDCLALLRRPMIALSFVGIMCHVGIDVGTNTTAPKILMERLSLSLNDAAFATSLYFVFRTIGCLTGAYLLRVLSHRLFFAVSVVMMLLAMVGLSLGTAPWVLYVSIALVGFGNSNIFSLIFSQALLSEPERQNEVSGLMIMGLFGGTIFPLLMGVAADGFGQVGAVLVMAVGVLYLFAYLPKIQSYKA
ncbi:MAG: MFS transporter, partial [Bacteroidaceae bacterium]|nr:MFS transporter [Bacteroidaceae bacterium]